MVLVSVGFFTKIAEKPHVEITLQNSITPDYFCPKIRQTGCIFPVALKKLIKPDLILENWNLDFTQKHKSIRLHA